MSKSLESRNDFQSQIRSYVLQPALMSYFEEHFNSNFENLNFCSFLEQYPDVYQHLNVVSRQNVFADTHVVYRKVTKNRKDGRQKLKVFLNGYGIFIYLSLEQLLNAQSHRNNRQHENSAFRESLPYLREMFNTGKREKQIPSEYLFQEFVYELESFFKSQIRNTHIKNHYKCSDEMDLELFFNNLVEREGGSIVVIFPFLSFFIDNFKVFFTLSKIAFPKEIKVIENEKSLKNFANIEDYNKIGMSISRRIVEYNSQLIEEIHTLLK